MSRSIKKHRNRMSCAELRGQSLTSFPGNIQEVAASGRSRRSDFRCMERKDVGSRGGEGGGAGFASQAWVFREFGEPSEDLRDPERGQGDSLNNWNRSQTSPLQNQMHLTQRWCLINVTVIHRQSVRELERNHTTTMSLIHSYITCYNRGFYKHPLASIFTAGR